MEIFRAARDKLWNEETAEKEVACAFQFSDQTVFSDSIRPYSISTLSDSMIYILYQTL